MTLPVGIGMAMAARPAGAGALAAARGARPPEAGADQARPSRAPSARLPSAAMSMNVCGRQTNIDPDPPCSRWETRLRMALAQTQDNPAPVRTGGQDTELRCAMARSPWLEREAPGRGRATGVTRGRGAPRPAGKDGAHRLRQPVPAHHPRSYLHAPACAGRVPAVPTPGCLLRVTPTALLCA